MHSVQKNDEIQQPVAVAGRQEPIAASVIIATRNRCDNLRQCLAALQETRGVEGAWEILVIDNNSTDATREVVSEFQNSGPAPVRYLFEGRRGKSAALNSGIEAARGAVAAFTDDDCIPDKYWLANVLAAFQQDPGLAVMGGRVELYDPRDGAVSVVLCNNRVEIPLDRAMRALFGGPSDAEKYGTVIGANMAVRRETFARMGLFDLFLAPGSTRAPLAVEDSDFTYRACRSGLKVLYSPETLVYHNHGRRTESQLDAVMRSYNRGRGAFYFKHILAGDIRVAKAAYWELKGYCRSLCSRGIHPAKRKNIWDIMRALFVGMTTQVRTIGKVRLG